MVPRLTAVLFIRSTLRPFTVSAVAGRPESMRSAESTLLIWVLARLMVPVEATRMPFHWLAAEPCEVKMTGLPVVPLTTRLPFTSSS